MTEDQINPIIATVRTILERDLPSVDHKNLYVAECPCNPSHGECDTEFVGANLEDYGVHLVKEHSLYPRSQRQLTDALIRESRRAEQRQRGQSDE